jgi:hypothetical protein
MVLLTTCGWASLGTVTLIARQGLPVNRLFVIRGDDPLTKATTPERNWSSQLLPRNTLRSTTGDATLPPMAAP